MTHIRTLNSRRNRRSPITSIEFMAIVYYSTIINFKGTLIKV